MCCARLARASQTKMRVASNVSNGRRIGCRTLGAGHTSPPASPRRRVRRRIPQALITIRFVFTRLQHASIFHVRRALRVGTVHRPALISRRPPVQTIMRSPSIIYATLFLTGLHALRLEFCIVPCLRWRATSWRRNAARRPPPIGRCLATRSSRTRTQGPPSWPLAPFV